MRLIVCIKMMAYEMMMTEFYILHKMYYTRENDSTTNTGKLGYDGLDGTRKIGPSYAKSVIYI